MKHITLMMIKSSIIIPLLNADPAFAAALANKEEALFPILSIFYHCVANSSLFQKCCEQLPHRFQSPLSFSLLLQSRKASGNTQFHLTLSVDDNYTQKNWFRVKIVTKKINFAYSFMSSKCWREDHPTHTQP